MRISDWSSDVCSSDLDLPSPEARASGFEPGFGLRSPEPPPSPADASLSSREAPPGRTQSSYANLVSGDDAVTSDASGQHSARMLAAWKRDLVKSYDHTSELPSLMRISYAVFCLTN